jgi:hypothetical protein
MNVERLNQRFAEFGRTPDGGLRFRWERTREMPFFIPTGYQEKVSESGILLGMERSYRKAMMADVYGDVWCLAQWKPFNEDKWTDIYGPSCPWSGKGFYMPVEGKTADGSNGVFLKPGQSPNLQMTETLVHLLRRELGIDAETREAEYQAAKEATDNEVVKQVDAEFDDLYPAFGNDNPGARGGHVSYGGFGKGERTNA